ncbi:MAG: hypothetical protein ACP5MD_03475 [Verrucomicrobiia bacterium]
MNINRLCGDWHGVPVLKLSCGKASPIRFFGIRHSALWLLLLLFGRVVSWQSAAQPACG